jgi:hypothetical protein
MSKQEHGQNQNASLSMQPVAVCGDVIDAGQDADGQVWVSVRRVSESMGLDPKSQQNKLKRKSWACGVLITSHDASGRNQEVFCIPLRALPMWLATIETSRVKPTLRAKLEGYQREAADVLANHFLPKTNAVDVNALVTLVQSLQAQVTALIELQLRSQNNVGILGSDHAAKYLARIRWVADAWVKQGRAKSRRSAIAAIRQDLIAATGYGGTGKRFAFMPMALREVLDSAVMVMERNVQRMNETRQLLAAKPEQQALKFQTN